MKEVLEPERVLVVVLQHALEITTKVRSPELCLSRALCALLSAYAVC